MCNKGTFSCQVLIKKLSKGLSTTYWGVGVQKREGMSNYFISILAYRWEIQI